jgi:hypothetical protein
MACKPEEIHRVATRCVPLQDLHRVSQAFECLQTLTAWDVREATITKHAKTNPHSTRGSEVVRFVQCSSSRSPIVDGIKLKFLNREAHDERPIYQINYFVDELAIKLKVWLQLCEISEERWP